MLDGRSGQLGNDKEYDFELKHNQMFMPKQVKYTVEVLKQAMNSFKHVLLLADKNHLDFIAEEWSASVEIDEKTGKAVTGAFKDIYESKELNISNITNYFEKLVIVDFLYGNPITHYFIKFKRPKSFRQQS